VRQKLLVGVALAGALAACVGARPAGDPARGRAVVDYWCADCHQVAPDRPATRQIGAPSLVKLANDPEKDAAFYRRFFAEVHPWVQGFPMPTILLSEGETEDVIAYLATLRGH